MLLHLLLALCVTSQGLAKACPTIGEHGVAGKAAAAVDAEPPPVCHGEPARVADTTRGDAAEMPASDRCCDASRCHCGMLHTAGIPLPAQAPALSAPGATQAGRIASAATSIALAPDTPPPIA